MKFLLIFFTAFASYLIGGINPAIVLSRLIYHQDIRECGSKNPGFTNFKRIYGNRYAWLVFAVDIGKAALCAGMAKAIFSAVFSSGQNGAAGAGFFAMLGHIYPVWYHFAGGKGFLVFITTVFFIDWRVGLIYAGGMLILLLITRYMSLSVVFSSFLCPLTMIWFDAQPIAQLLCLLSTILLIYRHRGNIRRFMTGTEPKFHL